MDLIPPIAGAGVSLVLWFAVLALRGEQGRRWVAVVLAALIPGAAVATTHHLQGQSFIFPPREFMDAVLLAGTGAVLLGILAGLGRGAWPRLAALLLFAVGGAALFYLPTEPLHERYWDGKVLLYVGVMTLIATLGYGGRLVAEVQGRTAESALAVALAAVAAAPALGLSGTALSAMNVAAVSSSAGLFGLMLVALLGFGKADERSFRHVGRAAATTQSALFAGLVANGVLYAETPRTAGILLLAAPLLALFPGRSLAGRPWLASMVRLTLVAGVAAFAAYLSKGEPDPYGY